jgi:hypothetical protein
MPFGRMTALTRLRTPSGSQIFGTAITIIVSTTGTMISAFQMVIRAIESYSA